MFLGRPLIQEFLSVRMVRVVQLVQVDLMGQRDLRVQNLLCHLLVQVDLTVLSDLLDLWHLCGLCLQPDL